MTKEQALIENKDTCCLMSDSLIEQIYADFKEEGYRPDEHNHECINCKHWNTNVSKGYCEQLHIYQDIGGCGDYWEHK